MKIVINMLENVDIKYLVLAGWVAMTMAYILFIGISARSVGYGEKFAKLEQREKELILENRLLEVQIAGEASLRVIDQKARKMGFIESKVQYIK